jgi:hypothetical protein
MVKIFFDEPSRIEINSDKDALEIINNGTSAAIAGKAANHIGVFGQSTKSHGVQGHSISGFGVVGSTEGTEDFKLNIFARGVQGIAPKGTGVVGVSDTHRGVWGQVKTGIGVTGDCIEDGTGVFGVAPKGTAILGRGKIADIAVDTLHNNALEINTNNILNS